MKQPNFIDKRITVLVLGVITITELIATNRAIFSTILWIGYGLYKLESE